MTTANSDIAISNIAIEQMRQVIIDSYQETWLEDMFRRAVKAGEYASLDAAVEAWLERQLAFRNEELLEDVFGFFMTSLVQDLKTGIEH